jgi:superfamily I DNA and/or RNA helicase
LLPFLLLQLPAWLQQVLDPGCVVAFLNTDTLQQQCPAAAAMSEEGQLAAALAEAAGAGGRPSGLLLPPAAAGGKAAGEVRVTEGIINPGEAQLVAALVQALLAAGVSSSSIGVTSPYSAQVQHLQQVLSGAGTATAQAAAGCADGSTHLERTSSDASSLEVLTIDRYQGREKPVILMSYVRSNAEGNVGNLLADWQRLNVALTRAQTKLVMVGSAQTLQQGNELTAQLMSVLGEEGWVMDLPADALPQQ